jgi:hypothetical protein
MQMQQQLQFDQSVSDRIQALLARVEGVRRGSDLKPTRFNAAGEQHARGVAERDRQTRGVGQFSESRSPKPYR